MKATEVTAGLAESNGSLLLGLRRDSLHVTCGLTACTPGSAPGPTLGNEYGKTLLFYDTVLLFTSGVTMGWAGWATQWRNNGVGRMGKVPGPLVQGAPSSRQENL